MEAASVHSSQADVWHLKEIVFGSRRIKIITQNFNGPCSFIAICNILILRGQIEILPPDRSTVSYEFLSQLVGEYLLTSCPDIDISAALSIMPSTTKGLDLNPQFTSITAFSPTSPTDAGELALFSQAGIQLVHGWVVDPESPEAAVMTHIRDYDNAVTLIADADYITRGRLLGRDGDGGGGGKETYGEPDAGPSPLAGSSAAGVGTHRARQSTTHYSDEDRHKIEHAIVARQFLDATKSQLTYHGLFQLASTLEPDSLVALFRNAHLSVVYKSPRTTSVTPQPNAPSHIPNANAHAANTNANPTHHAQDPALYALVTDDVFLHEPSIVWERLEDVDGYLSSFCDSDFHRAVPVGGDVAGQTAEGALRRFEMEAGLGVVDSLDLALARQIQAEEDERARAIHTRRHQALERRRRAEEEEKRRRANVNKGASGGKGRKNKNCVVM
ncbi:hypothetical protein HD554DRAFT_2207253 [Boletus coccyginus]|nr:hypothetical protein HD554DRAFT_2207253 [Boletus coccyginus]